MGLCLSQDQVEIVSNRDEHKALLDELGNTLGAEQEEAEDLVVSSAGRDHLVSCLLELSREVHLGEFVFLKQSHGHAEIVLAQKEHVDTLGGGDGIHVLDGVRGLDLEGDDDVLVSIADVAQQTLLVGRALGEVHRASTSSGVSAAAHGVGSLLRSVDVGHEDTIRTQVEGLLHAGAVIEASDTDHALGTARSDGAEHRAEVLSGHRPVLHVDQEPIKAKVRNLLSNSGAVRVDEETHLHLASSQLLLEGNSAFVSNRHFLFVFLKVEVRLSSL